MSNTYILYFDPGTINLSYCIVDIDTLKIKDWNKFSIKDNTQEGTCLKLYKELENRNLTNDIKTIVVHELQPSENSKTITICGQIQMYYVIKKKEQENSGIIKIVNHHAKHKIKYYEEQEGDKPMPTTRLNSLKGDYYRRKQIVIEHCRRILVQNNEEQKWIDFFEGSKKLDDLADCYVGALSYIKINELGKFKPKE